jgi:diaminohydroxyphosphoribosylaminopyrimidine deaminase/5-amino-6-(5-phosphoribosylamino)uracil reductase
VLDSDGKTPAKAVLFATASEIPTIVFTNTSDENWSAVLSENGVEIVSSESGARDLPSVLEELKARDIQSVLVEGGSEVAASFIRGGLVDKVTFIYSPLIVGSNDAPFAVGGEAIEMPLRLRGIEVDRLGDDIEVTGYPDGSS